MWERSEPRSRIEKQGKVSVAGKYNGREGMAGDLEKSGSSD